MAMEENIIQFNATNWVTVTLMLALSYGIMIWGYSLWKSHQG